MLLDAPGFAYCTFLPIGNGCPRQHIFNGRIRAGLVEQVLQFRAHVMHDHEHLAGFGVQVMADFRSSALDRGLQIKPINPQSSHTL